MPNALAVLALSDEGGMLHAPDMYMDKIAIGPGYADGIIDLDASPSENVTRLAKAKNVPVSSITACVLDRERHAKLIEELRRVGCAVRLIPDGDIAGVIWCTDPAQTGIDIYLGSGGAPEGVITACAIKCLRGGFQAQVINKETLKSTDGKIYESEDLVHGPCAFVATGITTGSLLKGVRYRSHSPETHSVFMRSESSTVRWLTTYHGN